jgi:hypothetical protein
MKIELIITDSCFFAIDAVEVFYHAMILNGYHPDTVLEAMEQFLRDGNIKEED